MGFFSSLCVGCNTPLLGAMAVTTKTVWMNDAVAIKPNGNIHTGSYDGYGSIDDATHATEGAECYHRACWERAGKPTTFTAASAAAPNQGWFYEVDLYDDHKPGQWFEEAEPNADSGYLMDDEEEHQCQ